MLIAKLTLKELSLSETTSLEPNYQGIKDKL